MSTSRNGDDANTLAQATLPGQQASTLPPADQQGSGLSTATDSQLHAQFKGIPVSQAQLSFDYAAYSGDVGNVGTRNDNAGNPQAFIAVVNQNQLPNNAALFGLKEGQIDGNNRSQAGTLLNAVAAEEVAQKIVQSSPQLQGMSKQKEELIGESALLNAMPEAYTRTMLRTSNVLNGQIPGNDYNAIADQTVASMQKTLDTQGYSNLQAKDLLKGFDAYTVQNGSRFNGLPSQSDPRAPYEAAFQDYFKSVGIKDVGAFQQALQTTMQQDFDTTSRKMISDQVQINTPAQNQPHTQSPGTTHSAAPSHDPKFAHLLEQARDGLQTIGPVRLGVQGQAAIDNTAGVMANDALSKKFDDFARITQNDNGMVFGMKQDPDKHPGPYDYVAVNPKLAADVPLAQSANSAQEHAGKNQQALLTQEPRGMSMG